MLGTWIADNTALADPPLLLDHERLSFSTLYEKAINKEGGLWCGGLSSLISWALNGLGTPALCYNFGYHAQHVSHVIVLVAHRPTKVIYPFDFYLGQGWYLEDGTRASLADILARAKLGRHGEIQVKQYEIYRDVLRPEGTQRERISADRFFGPETHKWALLQELAGQRTMHEFWLDTMSVNPELGKLYIPNTHVAGFYLESLMNLFSHLLEAI
jgi:hypothetical protein